MFDKIFKRLIVTVIRVILYDYVWYLNILITINNFLSISTHVKVWKNIILFDLYHDIITIPKTKNKNKNYDLCQPSSVGDLCLLCQSAISLYLSGNALPRICLLMLSAQRRLLSGNTLCIRDKPDDDLATASLFLIDNNTYSQHWPLQLLAIGDWQLPLSSTMTQWLLSSPFFAPRLPSTSSFCSRLTLDWWHLFLCVLSELWMWSHRLLCQIRYDVSDV